MKAHEAKLWADWRGYLTNVCTHVDRIETRVGLGVPDVMYSCENVFGWIELKINKGEPVSNWTPAQRLWAKKHKEAPVFFLLRNYYCEDKNYKTVHHKDYLVSTHILFSHATLKANFFDITSAACLIIKDNNILPALPHLKKVLQNSRDSIRIQQSF